MGVGVGVRVCLCCVCACACVCACRVCAPLLLRYSSELEDLDMNCKLQAQHAVENGNRYNAAAGEVQRLTAEVHKLRRDQTAQAAQLQRLQVGQGRVPHGGQGRVLRGSGQRQEPAGREEGRRDGEGGSDEPPHHHRRRRRCCHHLHHHRHHHHHHHPQTPPQTPTNQPATQPSQPTSQPTRSTSITTTPPTTTTTTGHQRAQRAQALYRRGRGRLRSRRRPGLPRQDRRAAQPHRGALQRYQRRRQQQQQH